MRSRSIKPNSMTTQSTLSRANSAEYGSLLWTFDPENHYLHPKIVHLLYSRWTFGIVMATLAPTPIIWLLPIWFTCLYAMLATVFVWIPYVFLIILSFNRDALGFILKSSEFWIKVIYAAMKGAVEIVRVHYVPQIRDEAPHYLTYPTQILGAVILVLGVIFVGGLDAVPKMKYKWKSVMLGMNAIYHTMEAIRVQMLEPKDRDFIILIQATKSEISFHYSHSSNKGRCISITYRPYLRWAKPGDDDSGLIDLEHLPESVAVVEADDDKTISTMMDDSDFDFVGL